MNTNNNMDDLIKRAQDMIKNNQIPDEVKQLMSTMSQSSNASSINNMPSSGTNKSGSTNNNIDMNAIMSLVNKLNSQASDDDMSRLLFALKPYLRNERKEKVDEYVKLVRMGKIAQLMDLFGGGKK